jgi:hypothetical protein
MKNLKILIAFLIIPVWGCVTAPVGKLTEGDFLSREIHLNMPISRAYNQLHDGLRYCGPRSKGIVIFATRWGLPECSSFREDGAVSCDLFLEGIDDKATNRIVGRIELKPGDNGTRAVLMVRHSATKKDEILKAYELFLNGDAKDVCPDM